MTPSRRLAPFILLAPFIVACMPRFAPIDTGKPLTDRDLALAFAKGENADADEFSEQLVVRVVMEDEASIYAKLTVTNLASADGRADLTVNVTLPGGRKLRFKERKDRDEWVFARDRFYAEVGDGSIEVGIGRTHITARNEEFELDLEVTSPLPPLRPKGGVFDRGGRFYVTTIAIPRGVAKARVTVLGASPEPEEPEPDNGPEPDNEENGESDANPETAAETMSAPDERLGVVNADADETRDGDPIALEGIGYVEHRAGNIAPYALARRWYSILDIGDEETVMLSVFEHAPPADARTPASDRPGPVQGFFFACNDEAIRLYEPSIDLRVRGWKTDEKTSYRLPEIIFVADSERASFEGVIVAGPLSERKDDLESLSKLERIVVRRFMKPWTFRFDRARYLFRKQNPGEAMREVRGSERLQVQQLN